MNKHKKYSKPGSEVPGSVSGNTTEPKVTYRRNPIESVLTALPLLMVIVGVGFYYYNERQQSGGDFDFEQTQHHKANYIGLSQQGKSVKAQRILWFETEEKKQRGARVNYNQAQVLLDLQNTGALEKGMSIEVWAAPRVVGSTVRWLYKLEANGRVFNDLTPMPHLNTETTGKQ